MAINDPYDRSGQYSNGDRGPKAEGYGGWANENPDRRDVAVGTLMGEGYRDSPAGYGAVLDAIENRISDIETYGGWGEKGNYGTRTHTGRGDHTLEGVVKAGNGAQFSTWSPSQEEAYGIATRGQAGKPRGSTEQGWYDQAMDVYDKYYGEDQFKGITRGATNYQNNKEVSAKAGAAQFGQQKKFGSTKIGSHTFTGPTFNRDRSFGSAYGDDEFSDMVGEWGDELGLGRQYGQPIRGQGATSFSNAAWGDDIPDLSSPQPTVISGSYGQSTLGRANQDNLTYTGKVMGMDPRQPGASLGEWGDDLSLNSQTIQPMKASAMTPSEDMLMGGYGTNTLAGSTISQDRIATAIRNSTPANPVSFSQNAQTSDPYGVGGFGWGEPGSYSDVVSTTFDPNGPDAGFFDSGWQESPELADKAAGVAYDPAEWGGAYTPGQQGFQGSVGGGYQDGGYYGGGTNGPDSSKGDGSYAESAGYSDNNPQGIL